MGASEESTSGQKEEPVLGQEARRPEQASQWENSRWQVQSSKETDRVTL